MKNRLIIGLFLALSIIQIITPLSMIMRREHVLKAGEQLKFKTEPVDPYDAFRGRYIALGFEERHAPAKKEVKLSRGQAVYAIIATDSQGFARFSAVETSRPHGKPYIRVRVYTVYDNKVLLDLPFDRYYMEEAAAPAAERIYREHTDRSRQEAYVTVRIKDGFAVIDGLYVAGKRIEEMLKK